MSLPVYKQSKALPGQLLFHLLVNAINIHNCFSRHKRKENIFPTAEDMKGRIQNMKKCLELLHCFRHKLSVYIYHYVQGQFVPLFPGFSPDPIHGAETNKLAAAPSSSNGAGKTETVMQPVLAAPSDNTPGKTAPTFHSEPRRKILMKKCYEWLLSLGPL